jgi:predicted RNase H-like HicB family nuclease
MKIKIIIEKTRSGYSAYAEKFPVFTTGKTLDDLKNQILEALNLYFKKENKVVKEADLQINLDLPQFFEFFKVINAKALSERIGMNQSLLAQYIKGHKKPSTLQTQRILKGVQQIGNELSSVRFLL